LYAPIRQGYIKFSVGLRFNIEGARNFLKKALELKTPREKELAGVWPDYNPGEANMFQLSFQGISPIK